MSTTVNNRRTKRLPRIILNQSIVGLIMFLMAASILFYAQGYRFNWKSMKLIRTGIVNVETYPKNAQVYIDGKLREDTTPFSENLTEGLYSIEVKKDGYQSWGTSFRVEPELVNSFQNIILFKSDPQIDQLTDTNKIALIKSPIDYLAGSGPALTFSDYEIWLGDSLLTRFSAPIYHVILYPDREHVLYQQGDEIRILDAEGKNDMLLVKLSQAKPTQFTISAKGDELYYLDAGQYYIAYIR